MRIRIAAALIATALTALGSAAAVAGMSYGGHPAAHTSAMSYGGDPDMSYG